MYLSGIIFFHPSDVPSTNLQHTVGWMNHFWTLERVHVPYFKKQLIPPPCCLSFYTEYNIHERAQINSPGEQRPLCTEQLLSGSPIHPPQACASNLFWGHYSREWGNNGTITSLRFPTSLLTLSVCDNFTETFSLLGIGLWTLLCISWRPLNVCMVLSLWHGGIAFKLLARTTLNYFKHAESPLWLADFMPCWGGALWLADSPHPDLLGHLCMCRSLLCGGTTIAESVLRDLQSCSLLGCHWQSHDFATCRVVTSWRIRPLLLAVCLAAYSGLSTGLRESTASPQRDFKTLARSLEVCSDWCQRTEGRKPRAHLLASAIDCLVLTWYLLFIACPASGLLLSCWLLFLLVLAEFGSESLLPGC